jgi:hypothetical protein
MGYWPEARSYKELLVFPWAFGVMFVLSVLASIAAARLTSPRWYYLTALLAMSVVVVVLAVVLLR